MNALEALGLFLIVAGITKAALAIYKMWREHRNNR